MQTGMKASARLNSGIIRIDLLMWHGPGWF